MVSIISLLQGQTAAAFRQKATDIVVTELPDNHPMRLFGQAVETDRQKRTLDDDEEVYAAKKQQVLRQIRQEAASIELAVIKQHAQDSMGILDMLSAGGAPPATMQLLQTIRHNVTARLGSMIETGVQGMLALEATPQQHE